MYIAEITSNDTFSPISHELAGPGHVDILSSRYGSLSQMLRCYDSANRQLFSGLSDIDEQVGEKVATSFVSDILFKRELSRYAMIE